MDYNLAVENILVERSNIQEWDKFFMEQASIPNNLFGYDIETSQRDAHEGIKRLMKTDDEGYSKGKKLLFDFKRTKITGASFYFGKTHPDKAFYVNFGHADVENTICISYLIKWVETAKRNTNSLIIHNVPYEYCVHKGSYGQTLPNTLCSMQLCITAYNPDEYKKQDLPMALSLGIRPLIADIERTFAMYQHGKLTFQQEELLGKFCAKSGKASHCYEGIVKDISYGYGLKKAVKSWFGYQMTEFKDTVGDEPDMEALTARQVLAYGADDAIWAYRLFFRVYQYLQQVNPEVIATYLNTENPITREFAEATLGGMRVNREEIVKRQGEMRNEFAIHLVKMKEALREVFPEELPPMHEKLLKYEKWYKETSHLKYYNLVRDWLNTPDDLDAYSTCIQVSCAPSNAWMQDVLGINAKPKNKLSVNHYMAMRFILFVVCDLPCNASGGKIQSDKDARAAMLEKYPDSRVLQAYAKMASSEQAFKLYITPYLCLIDPETGLMHPQMSSMLATRRTSCSNPNGQQLAKRGDSVFVRGFYKADDDDSVIVSADWSAIELVGVAANSQDPEFLKAYGQRPHDDLHSTAAAGVMGLTMEEFAALVDKKEMRTVLGKGANFEYWYSGWLMNTAKKMGWDLEKTAEATKGYAEKFWVAEKWRLSVQEQVQNYGFIKLGDHHTRTRFEATFEWSEMFLEVFQSFDSEAVMCFAREAMRRITRRSLNQAVNFAIQGMCAALAKRTILRVNKEMKEAEFKARFLLLIHDELLFSVPKAEAAAFCDFLYEQMIQDSDLFPNVKIDSSVAVGYTFQPFDPEKAPYGQIELMEVQKGVPVVPETSWGNKASVEERDSIIKYLTEREAA